MRTIGLEGGCGTKENVVNEMVGSDEVRNGCWNGCVWNGFGRKFRQVKMWAGWKYGEIGVRGLL